MKKKIILLFDYDGPIVNSEKVVKNVLNTFFPKYGLAKIRNIKDLGKLYEENFYQSVLKRGIEKKHIPEMLELTRKELIKRENKIKLVKGMKKVLKKIAENGELIIITSNITLPVQRYLKKQGMLNLFSQIIGADKGGTSKSQKIEKIKKKNPAAEIYYIGDTRGDIIEGKKAGVKTIAVSWGFHSKKHLAAAKPDMLAGKPKDILKVME